MSNIIQSLPFYLNQPLGATDTTIQVKGLKNSRGVAITAMPSGVALIHVTIEPKSPTNQEIISFTGITDNGNGVVTLTGVTRNLNPVSPFTALTADVPHANNSTCVISNNPQIFQDVVMTNEARTVSAVVTFGASPIVPTAVNPGEPVNKSQLDLAVLGTVPASSTTVLGAVRVATDPTKTLGTATLTIASPCVVSLASHGLLANDTIRFTTTGALPTGLVVGTTYYVLSTGLTSGTFQLSLTLGGTAVVTTGSQSGTHTLYRTTPYAVNDQDTRLPTQAENDALVGTSGTPSNSNKYVTSEGLTATLASTFKFGGTGADGALNVTSGTTNIDCAGATFVEKNYTSINVSVGATLAFINPANSGTVVHLKSQGAVTIAGTVNASGCGTVGGAANTSGGTGTAGTTVDPSILFVAGGGTGGSGAVSNTGGAGGSAPTSAYFYIANAYTLSTRKPVAVACGTGGGGGSSAGALANGAGGRGGGAIYIECNGAWNFTGTINVSGVAGSNAGSGGGGGGGGAGMLLALYNTLTASSGTVTNNSGAGGNGGAGGNAGGGGGGNCPLGTAGAGATSSGAGVAGTNGGGGGGGSFSGGAGGASSTNANLSYIAKNNYFV